MNDTKTDVLIIGAGLTGLTLAYLLREECLKVTIVDARDRVGGRICTIHDENHPPLELGATWFGRQHTSLESLLEELDIGRFKQLLGLRAIYEPISTSPPQVVTLPPNDEPSYRVKGGSDQIIEGLLKHISKGDLHFNQVVKSIELKEDNLIVKSPTQSYHARFVVSTLPPFLFHKTISINPSLPKQFTEIAAQTHTWMGESIKVALTYVQPFWRDEKFSGTIFSNVGPVPEMYDHANEENSLFALVGFINGTYYSISKKERLDMVLQQLEKYYGSIVYTYLTYQEKIWRMDANTFAEYEHHVLPHQNGGHQVYQTAYLNNQLFVAGAETAEQYAGYMEGAVRSAKFVFKQLKLRDS